MRKVEKAAEATEPRAGQGCTLVHGAARCLLDLDARQRLASPAKDALPVPSY